MGRPVKDLRGKRYGKLVVISFAETRKGRAHWVVQCDCGMPRVVSAGNLQSGTTRSCGECHNDSLKKPLATVEHGHG